MNQKIKQNDENITKGHLLILYLGSFSITSFDFRHDLHFEDAQKNVHNSTMPMRNTAGVFRMINYMNSKTTTTDST